MKALCAITPAALGPQYFRECAEVIDATPGGAPDKDQEDDEKQTQAARGVSALAASQIVMVNENLFIAAASGLAPAAVASIGQAIGAGSIHCAMEEIVKVIAFLLRFRTPAYYQKSVNELSKAAKY